MVTTAMGSPVVAEALTGVPDLEAGAEPGAELLCVFSCCTRRVPAALTLARDPTRTVRAGAELRIGAHGRSEPRSSPVAVCERAKSVQADCSAMRSPRLARRANRCDPAHEPSTSAGRATRRPQAYADRRRTRSPPAGRMIGRMRTLVRAALVAVLLVAGADRPAGAVRGRRRRAPSGVWPLVPEPDGRAPVRPARRPWGAGHRGVDLAGHPGQAGPRRAGRHGRLRRLDRRRRVVAVDHGATRTTYEPVVATVARRRRRCRPASAIGRLVVAGSHCFPAACLHWGWHRAARPTSTRCASSAPARCGCCRCGATTRSPPGCPGLPPLDQWRRPLDWLA